MPNTTSLPVAIIGAGPIGLAAAAHLHARGEAFVILEAGSAVGASLRQWSHVQVFSPWRYLIDDAARDLMASTGWSAPDPEGYPTGGEIVSAYLEPLAATGPIEAALRLNTRVTSVSRKGYDKLKSAGREAALRHPDRDRRQGRPLARPGRHRRQRNLVLAQPARGLWHACPG
jgi:cation diffusion facilitator CzcD-associated flavoprotein CzcO